MRKFVHPKLRYLAKIKKLQAEVKSWKSKYAYLNKKYKRETAHEKEKLFRSRIKNFES